MSVATVLPSISALTLVLAMAGCPEEPPPDSPPEVAPPAHDASVEGRRGKNRKPPAAIVAEPPARPDLTPLEGSWRGRAMTADYGLVIARLSVTREGKVFCTVTGQGTSTSDQLTIEAWDGERLRLRHGTDKYEIEATLSGDTLEATLPVVGKVTFTRESS